MFGNIFLVWASYYLVIFAILFPILCIIIRNNIKWNCLLSLGLSHFVLAIIAGVIAFFYGTGLGNLVGPVTALLTTFAYIYLLWFITLPAVACIAIAINETSKAKRAKKQQEEPKEN